MKLKDEAGWQKCKAANDDPYGFGVVRFVERWADMMEVLIAGWNVRQARRASGRTE